jgi:hypothetical protein
MKDCRFSNQILCPIFSEQLQQSKYNGIEDTVMDDFGSSIIKQPFALLSPSPATACLVTTYTIFFIEN